MLLALLSSFVGHTFNLRTIKWDGRITARFPVVPWRLPGRSLKLSTTQDVIKVWVQQIYIHRHWIIQPFKSNDLHMRNIVLPSFFDLHYLPSSKALYGWASMSSLSTQKFVFVWCICGSFSRIWTWAIYYAALTISPNDVTAKAFD